MSTKKIEINYLEYDSIDELPEEDKILIQSALNISENAYAPYSHFKVGAVVEFLNGERVLGSNQENMAYPSGLCAERVAVFSASSLRPRTPIKTIAIAARNEKGEIANASPCGACRQVLLEYESSLKHPIRVLFFNNNRKILSFNSVSDILPFHFEM